MKQIIAAGWVVADEGMLRSIVQSAVLDAHSQERLNAEGRARADHSAEIELDRQRTRAENAERDAAAARVWWRRWLPRVAVVAILAGVTSLGLTVYLISRAKEMLAQEARTVSAKIVSDQVTEAMTAEMTQIAVRAAEKAVEASEARTERRILDMQAQVSQDIRGEFVLLRESLVQELQPLAP